MLRTNSKKVMDMMKKEVLSNYSPEQLKENLRAVTHTNATTYARACLLVDGGCFLVYTEDIDAFLKKVLEWDDCTANKNFDRSFDIYKHLIARACVNIVEG